MDSAWLLIEWSFALHSHISWAAGWELGLISSQRTFVGLKKKALIFSNRVFSFLFLRTNVARIISYMRSLI